ncbi:hypothetical protein [Streptomyces mayteni]
MALSAIAPDIATDGRFNAVIEQELAEARPHTQKTHTALREAGARAIHPGSRHSV